MEPLNKANQYINENASSINKEYRHSYHLMAPIGWINDPNGFIYYQNQYHLFYQHYPYDSIWGPMHWGHAVSDDLVQWKNLPIALAPDQEYDKSGVFSGSAFVENNILHLCYTGHQAPDPKRPDLIRQVQAIAYSEDGILFTKDDNNPIISTDMLPKHARVQDFRDPKLFKRDNNYYIIAGSRNVDDSGQLLVYISKDLKQWDYYSTLMKSDNKIGKMWECPDFFTLDGKAIEIITPQELPQEGFKYSNVFSCIYMIGQADKTMKQYRYECYDEIDSGLDFYAPQTMIDPKGRRIMVAWMSMWSRNNVTGLLGHGWSGAMTLPRELKMINNKLYQLPIQEIEKYRRDLVEYNSITVDKKVELEGIRGQKMEMEMVLKFKGTARFVIHLFEGDKEKTSVMIEPGKNLLTFDRRESGELIAGEEEEPNVRKVVLPNLENGVKLRFFLDRSSVELFINDGATTMTALVYPGEDSDRVSFISDGSAEIIYIKKWTIYLRTPRHS